MMYKRKNEKKIKNGSQGCGCWLWSLLLWMGFGSCPMMFSSLGELAPMFWLMELDLISEGSAVSSSRFWSVCGFSVPSGSSSNFRSVAAAATTAAKSPQSCPTLRPHRWQPTRLRHPWDSLGKNTGVGCHFLLQCMKVKSESEITQLCINDGYLSYPLHEFG